MKMKKASKIPFDGNPHTRLAGAERAIGRYMGHGCVRFKTLRAIAS